MKKLVTILALLAALFSTFAANTKNPVVVTEENAASLLDGEWIGRLESYYNGRQVWSGSISITIYASNKRANFTLESFGSWDSPLEITNGKPKLRIGFAMREFSVYETENGMIMEVKYTAPWQGWPRDNYVYLRKQK